MKYQSFCSYCDWDVTLQLKQILIQTHLHKCIRIATAALRFPVFLCEYTKYGAGTNLPLFLQESRTKKKKQQTRVFFPSVTTAGLLAEFFITTALLFSPCCSYHVNTIESLRNQKLPLAAILHVTETRVPLKLVMACALSQRMTVAKAAH